MAMWDFLRPLIEVAQNLEFLTKFLVLIFSTAFVFIAIKAYMKKKTKKLLYIAVAFGLFTLQAVLQIIDIIYSPGYFFNPAAQAVVQLLVIAILFFAIFKKE